MTISRWWFCFLAGAAFAAEQPAGQQEPFSADRPGFSDGVNVLARGVTQLEGGMSFDTQRRNGDTDHSLTLGAPLFRMGIGNGVELRVGGDGFRSWSLRSPLDVERANGFTDLTAGLKWRLAGESGWRPTLSLVSFVSLPVGEDAFTSFGYDPTVKFAWSKSLPRGYSAGGNVNLSSLTDERGRFFQNALSLGFDHELARGLDGFWEAYTIRPVERGGGAIWTFETGVAYSVGSNAAMDVSVGRQITPFASCWSVSMGFAIRNPAGFRLRR